MQNMILNKYKKASKRIIFLDYDGTLTPFTKIPAEAKISGTTRKIIKQLAVDPRNKLVIISGRDKIFLENQFAGLPVTLIGEHGFFIKEDGRHWNKLVPGKALWHKEVDLVFDDLYKAVPGSMIEIKVASRSWHYRNSTVRIDNNMRSFIREKITYLKSAYPSLDILEGKKVIEIKPAGYNKGSAALKLIRGRRYDFIFAAGDDCTDESLFKVLSEKGYTVKIGKGGTAAKFRLGNQSDLLKLLLLLSKQV